MTDSTRAALQCAVEVERTEATLGRALEPGERCAFEVAYRAGYVAGFAACMGKIEEVQAEYVATLERRRRQAEGGGVL